MDLTVVERLMLLNLLPAEGDITTLRIVRELREALSFTEEEHERYRIRIEEGRVHFVDDGTVVAVEMGAKAKRLVTDKLEAMNKDGKLTEQHLGLCEKLGIE